MAGLLDAARSIKRKLKWALYDAAPDRLVNAIIRLKMPRSAHIETTTACNLRCPLCITHDTPRGYRHLDVDHVHNVLNGCGKRMKIVSLHLMGEPLLNKDLFGIIRACSAAGVKTFFSTNGMLLDRHIDEVLESGLTCLSIAIDGADAEDYRKYRVGGDFDRVIDNVRRVVAEKRRRGADAPEIQVQMVMFSYNEDREDEAVSFIKSLGVDVVSLKRPAYLALESEEASDFLAQVDHENPDRKYARPIARPDELYRNQRLCPELEGATILSDGSVVACCIDARGDTAFGNLNESSFKSIWRGKAHRELIDRFMQRRLETCRHCTLGTLKPESLPKRVDGASREPAVTGRR